MSLKKDALRATVAGDTRDLAKTSSYEGKGKTRVYQIKFNVETMERFRRYCESKGLTLSAGTRLAVAEYMEKQGV